MANNSLVKVWENPFVNASEKSSCSSMGLILLLIYKENPLVKVLGKSFC